MGVHLYTNGAWTDSGRIYRNSVNLFDISKWVGATAQRGTLVVDATNYTVEITATSGDAYTSTYGNSYFDIPVISGETYTLTWDVEYPEILGNIFLFSGTTAATGVLLYRQSTALITQFQIPDNHELLGIRLGVNTQGETQIYKNIMIYRGTKTISYEPYNVIDWYTNTGHSYSSGAWS